MLRVDISQSILDKWPWNKAQEIEVGYNKRQLIRRNDPYFTQEFFMMVKSVSERL